MIYLIASILVALVLAFFLSRKSSGKEEVPREVADDCCGAHEVCEADSLLNHQDKPVYYEDEELDRYKDCKADDYTDEQIEEFREVLLTLKEKEVSGWLKSLQLRHVKLPSIVREEALMIVADRRSMA